MPVSGPAIESGTVVVARGLIQSVGTSATIPPEAWVIDGKGLTVYPGLIDAGSSVGLGDDGAGAKKAQRGVPADWRRAPRIVRAPRPGGSRRMN